MLRGMALTSASTHDDALAQLQDNLDFESTSNTTKALLVREACYHLMVLRPKLGTKGSMQAAWDNERLADLITRADQHIAIYGTAPTPSGSNASVRHLTFSGGFGR